jgi:hypothetical protein
MKSFLWKQFFWGIQLLSHRSESLLGCTVMVLCCTECLCAVGCADGRGVFFLLAFTGPAALQWYPPTTCDQLTFPKSHLLMLPSGPEPCLDLAGKEAGAHTAFHFPYVEEVLVLEVFPASFTSPSHLWVCFAVVWLLLCLSMSTSVARSLHIK